MKVYAEVERPPGFVVSLAAVGTIVYFLEVLLYLFLTFIGLIYALNDFPFHFELPFILHMQIIGLVLTSVGYLCSFGALLSGVDVLFRGRCRRIKNLSLGVHTIMCGTLPISAISLCFSASSSYGLTCLLFFL